MSSKAAAGEGREAPTDKALKLTVIGVAIAAADDDDDAAPAARKSTPDEPGPRDDVDDCSPLAFLAQLAPAGARAESLLLAERFDECRASAALLLEEDAPPVGFESVDFMARLF